MEKDIANRILWGVVFVTVMWWTTQVMAQVTSWMLYDKMKCADAVTHPNAIVLVEFHNRGVYSCFPRIDIKGG